MHASYGTPRCAAFPSQVKHADFPLTLDVLELGKEGWSSVKCMRMHLNQAVRDQKEMNFTSEANDLIDMFANGIV